MKFNKEDFIHFRIGENKVCFPDEEFIIKMDYPRCQIRYRLDEGYFADYNHFMNNIAEIQRIDGEIPSKQEQEEILSLAWNFLAIDERLLEDDLSDIDFDE